ncbi:protein of unknown function [Pseudomonas inefficax]|uniref:Uncharacterized protein n=1 Tax=Pseudomonas inefficax TaxID=2078786 RepID=A0AAQ1PCX9_9PSED|nr:protein of unknown function [Pseudomonas inefficax]
MRTTQSSPYISYFHVSPTYRKQT